MIETIRVYLDNKSRESNIYEIESVTVINNDGSIKDDFNDLVNGEHFFSSDELIAYIIKKIPGAIREKINIT